MVLLSLVASHQNVDLNTVARLSTGAEALPHTLVGPDQPLSGLVVLSTCNRLELYTEVPGESPTPAELDAAVEDVVRVVAQQTGLSPDFVRDSLQRYTDEATAEHLFTVVSGLESAVVGEREITGQVRRALTRAREENLASGELVRLFEAAARTARRVGTQTSLGERGRSIVSVALDLAEEVSEVSWEETRALVFGTGAYAGATMAALAARGCSRIMVYSGSGRAEEFTAKRGGQPLREDQLAEALAASDLVIGCSGGSAPMPAEQLPRGRRVIVDLALTRDFSPEVADAEGVELITLESVRLAAPEETVESIEAAREIVADSTREFAEHRSERSVDAAIVALRRHTMGVLEREMEKVHQQYGCGGRADQLEFAMRRMMHSLLHTPMVNARKLAAQGREDEFAAALEALYGLDLGQSEPVEEAVHGAPAQPLEAHDSAGCRAETTTRKPQAS